MLRLDGDAMVAEAPKMQAVASVEIHLLPSGQIMARTTGNRPQFNMMMATAWQDLSDQLKEQEKANRVVLPPPGLKID